MTDENGDIRERIEGEYDLKEGWATELDIRILDHLDGRETINHEKVVSELNEKLFPDRRREIVSARLLRALSLPDKLGLPIYGRTPDKPEEIKEESPMIIPASVLKKPPRESIRYLWMNAAGVVDNPEQLFERWTEELGEEKGYEIVKWAVHLDMLSGALQFKQARAIKNYGEVQWGEDMFEGDDQRLSNAAREADRTIQELNKEFDFDLKAALNPF